MEIVRIIEPELWHVRAILDNLRDLDQHVFDQCVYPEAKIMSEIKRATIAFTGMVYDKVACLWGANASSIIVDEFYVWLLTTKLVDEHSFLFVRYSQLAVKELLKERSLVRGHVLVNNRRSIRWLQWLGCEIKPLDDEPAILEFKIRRA